MRGQSMMEPSQIEPKCASRHPLLAASFFLNPPPTKKKIARNRCPKGGSRPRAGPWFASPQPVALRAPARPQRSEEGQSRQDSRKRRRWRYRGRRGWFRPQEEAQQGQEDGGKRQDKEGARTGQKGTGGGALKASNYIYPRRVAVFEHVLFMYIEPAVCAACCVSQRGYCFRPSLRFENETIFFHSRPVRV